MESIGNRYGSVEEMVRATMGKESPEFVDSLCERIDASRLAKGFVALRCKAGKSVEEVAEEMGWNVAAVEEMESATDDQWSLKFVREYLRACGYGRVDFLSPGE